MTVRALIVTNMWPTAADPAFGVFVREQVEAVRSAGARCDVRFVNGRAGRRAYAAAVPSLRRELARGGYDVVHAHHALSGLATWLAARSCRAAPPWLLTHHGIEVFDGWQAPLARWLTPRADWALVVSPAMARRLDLTADHVMPMGVDLTAFRPGDRAAARARLGLPPGGALIAWVGADRPEKRLWLARQAVARLRETLPEAELLVVSGLEHAAVALWLTAADALLLTSAREGAPVVVKEALACDRPVVSTDVGDVRQLVAPVAGCAVVAATPEALADGLRRALQHGPVQGRAAVAAYDVRLLARRLMRLYERLARESAGIAGRTA